MKLFSGPVSMYGAKAEMAVLEKGIAAEVEFVPFTLKKHYAPKHPDVLRINPKAEVPVLIDKDLELFDSTQLFEYFESVVPEPPLWPKRDTQRARARLLEHSSDEVFFPDVVLLMPRRRAKHTESERDEAMDRLQAYRALMNDYLDGNAYLVDEFSYADIAFYAADFFARFLGAAPDKGLSQLEEWRSRMNDRKSVQAVMGKMAEYLTSRGVPASL